jgi:DNA-binding response OmpR family regulator
LQRANPARSPAVARKEEAMADRKRILVVDDSRTAQMMTTMIINKGSYDVLTASDGEEGVQKATLEKPDLILMDVMMPKMDGFEACRRLRSQEATKNIPVIIVTTRGEAVNVEIGYEVGCTDYVTKPINSAELLAKIRNYLT